jgi:hypothetical protein
MSQYSGTKRDPIVLLSALAFTTCDTVGFIMNELNGRSMEGYHQVIPMVAMYEERQNNVYNSVFQKITSPIINCVTRNILS